MAESSNLPRPPPASAVASSSRSRPQSANNALHPDRGPAVASSSRSRPQSAHTTGPPVAGSSRSRPHSENTTLFGDRSPPGTSSSNTGGLIGDYATMFLEMAATPVGRDSIQNMFEQFLQRHPNRGSTLSEATTLRTSMPMLADEPVPPVPGRHKHMSIPGSWNIKDNQSDTLEEDGLPTPRANRTPPHEDSVESITEAENSQESVDSFRTLTPMSATDLPGQIAGPDRTSKVLEHHELGKSRKIAIAVFIVLSQLVQMIPIGAGLTAALQIGKELGTTKGEAVWLAASYPLTQGAFIVAGGRVGALYGHKKTLLLAGAWWIVWSVVSGFMPSIITLSLTRALTGVGGGFMVPNAVAIIGITFPPGKGRNICMGLFGAMGPIGASGGSVFGGLFVQLTPWKYLFFFLACLGAVVFGGVWLVVPAEEHPLAKGKLDWIGAYLGIGGLVLFNFVWNQAPAVGWTTIYEYTLLAVAALHFAAFILWEGKYAKDPIMPLNIWNAPSFGALVLVSLFSFMSFGILIWYIIVWVETLRDWTLLGASAAIVPMTVVGAFASFFAAWLIPRIAAQYIMALGTSAILGSTIIVATMPAKQLYWAQLFPAAVLMALCPDFVFTAAQIITSNSVQKHEQGVAGSLIGTLLTYGMSMGLGFAGTVEMRVNNNGKDIVEGYRGALYVAIGLAGAALAIDLLCVRMPKDVREGWDEDMPSRAASRVASRLGIRSRSARSNRAGGSPA